MLHVRSALVGAAAALALVSSLLLAFHLASVGAEPPSLYDGELDPALIGDYPELVGIAHNSGNSRAAIGSALDHDADAIEIDVILVGDRLYAAHDRPPGYIRPWLYQGATLDEAWRDADGASIIALDLKDSTPRAVNRLADFLAKRGADADGPRVVVTTGDARTLRRLHTEAPAALRFLTISSRPRLDRLRADPELTRLLDGVSIRQDLIDAESAGWLRGRGLLMTAWTVNDLARVNELARLGVDAMTTDNLALLELLGGKNDDQLLERRAAVGGRSPRLGWEP